MYELAMSSRFRRFMDNFGDEWMKGYSLSSSCPWI
uniref:Uncharacterized protein n=1 Tax=Arundo donax TaxID=35708 RepID=A0A0A9AZJ1_ARUDO